MNRIGHLVVSAGDGVDGRPCACCYGDLAPGDVAIGIAQKRCAAPLVLHRDCAADGVLVTAEVYLIGRPCAGCRRRLKAGQPAVVIRQPARVVPGVRVVDGECAVHAACLAEAVAAAPVESDEAADRQAEHALTILVRAGDEDYLDYLDGRRLYPPLASVGALR